MLYFLFLLAIGSVGLYLGAEWLVRGAAGLAAILGVRPLAIGLTVVAYGTSAPELVVSTLAALDGKSALALGNVVGSNIANIGLILGVTCLIAPPLVKAGLMRRELPIMLAATIAVPGLLSNGTVSRLEGAALLLGALAFTWITLKSVQASAQPAPTTPATVDAPLPVREDPHIETLSRAALVGVTLAGLAVLGTGGKLFVDGAVGIALAVGISERVVGLTIVAIGTSLPELAASLVAALRGHSDIAVGNVLGSNIFNILLILGAAALVRPVSAELMSVRFDLLALGVLTVFCAIAMRTARKIQRFEGALLLAGYAAFLGVLAAGS